MTLPKINRRAWLAIWLQDRRRARQPVTLPPPAVETRFTVEGEARVTFEGDSRNLYE